MEIYELKHPIKLTEGGAEITSVQFIRPKGKHLKKLPISALEGSDVGLGVLFPFLSKWLSLPLDILDELDGEDLFYILEELQPFLPGSPEIGKK